MQSVDMNLLAVLDVLLSEGSVTRAAGRLGLSVSAMSRTLTRLRAATGDALLVRAGRGLVPTPHAAALRARVHAAAREARTLLQPAAALLDLSSLDATFTLRASESFMDMLASTVVAAILDAAPQVRLRFVPKHDRDATVLRDGRIDLQIGKRGSGGPEVRTELLFADAYVGIAHRSHPLLARGPVTAKRLAACRYVVSSQVDDFSEELDAALEHITLVPAVRVVVPGYPDAMRIAARSDLVGVVPRSSLGNTIVKDRAAELGLRSFELPGRMPAFSIHALWHPRVDADPAQRWFRQQVITACRRAYPRRPNG